MTNDDKLKAALAYLGTKHVLHPQYDGKHSVIESDANVGLTIKRAKRRQAEARPINVVQWPVKK